VTDQATRVVPAGWYDDPASPSRVRWWNGLTWTEHVTEKPQRRIAPAAVDTREQQIAEARRPEEQFGVGTREIPQLRGVDLAAESRATGLATLDPAPALSRREARAESQSVDDPTTGGAWFVALSPIVWVVLGAIAGYVYVFVTANPLLLGVAVVAILLTLLPALADARALRGRGYRPPTGALAIVSALLYLIARRARVPGNGPLVAFAILAVVVVGGPIAGIASGALAPVSTALDIQRQLTTQLVADGTALSVSCPVLIESVAPGTLYTCDAVRPDGAPVTVWVSIDGGAGDFSYALAVN
jgi:hypothetical protein